MDHKGKREKLLRVVRSGWRGVIRTHPKGPDP